jgi:hypothetical protein
MFIKYQQKKCLKWNAFFNMPPCNLIEVNWCFVGIYYFQLHGRWISQENVQTQEPELEENFTVQAGFVPLLHQYEHGGLWRVGNIWLLNPEDRECALTANVEIELLNMKPLIDGFAPRRPGFEPRSNQVGSVEDGTAMGNVFSDFFGFPCHFPLISSQ